MSYPTIWLKYRLYPSRVSCWNIKTENKKDQNKKKKKNRNIYATKMAKHDAINNIHFLLLLFVINRPTFSQSSKWYITLRTAYVEVREFQGEGRCS